MFLEKLSRTLQRVSSIRLLSTVNSSPLKAKKSRVFSGQLSKEEKEEEEDLFLVRSNAWIRSIQLVLPPWYSCRFVSSNANSCTCCWLEAHTDVDILGRADRLKLCFSTNKQKAGVNFWGTVIHSGRFRHLLREKFWLHLIRCATGRPRTNLTCRSCHRFLPRKRILNPGAWLTVPLCGCLQIDTRAQTRTRLLRSSSFSPYAVEPILEHIIHGWNSSHDVVRLPRA